MNKELLQNALNVEFKGKKFNNYCASDELSNYIQKLFDNFEPTRKIKAYVFRSDHKTKYFDLKIINESTNGNYVVLCVIKVNKTKNWKDEYFYKDFEVCQDFDIDKRIEQTMNKLHEKEREEKAKITNLAVLYKNISLMYPNKDKGKLRVMIRELAENIWTIEDMVLEEEKR